MFYTSLVRKDREVGLRFVQRFIGCIEISNLVVSGSIPFELLRVFVSGIVLALSGITHVTLWV